MKINLGLVCGGKTTEHEISLLSAQSIINAINYNKYNLCLITIDKSGNWYLSDKDNFIEEGDDANNIKLIIKEENKIALVPENDSNRIINLKTGENLGKLDVIFSIIHGTTGEDGCMQGYFNILNVPFVGCDVLGSAIGMDKEVSKILAERSGIPVAKYVILRDSEKQHINYNKIIEELKFPVFVKPATLGSSVGIRKAKNKDELIKSINFAFKFDQKLVIEEGIVGREIECAVLGNDDVLASVPGEIIPNHEFYSYEAKYLDKEGAKLEMPAKLTKEQTTRLQELAVKTFKILNGKGLARVDFFLDNTGRFIFNEINTLPGFTNVSMYSKLFGLSGIKYPELVDKLIELGIEHYNKKKEMVNNLKTI